MSTTMNSIQINNETINDVFNDNNNINSFKHNNNSLHLRDQLNKFLSESFIQGTKDETNIPSKFSSLVNSKKIEKIQNLENKIVEEEKRIQDLEKAKEQKLIKIEDLRKIIERIASEDCYDKSNFVVIKSKRFVARERSWSSSSNKLERNVSTITNSTAHVSDISIKGDSENDDSEGACDGDCKKECDRALHRSNNSSKNRFSCNSADHLQNCLLYWQDNIYPNGYKA